MLYYSFRKTDKKYRHFKFATAFFLHIYFLQRELLQNTHNMFLVNLQRFPDFIQIFPLDS